MSNTKTDWTVHVYNDDDTIMAQWVIEDRTEREAEKEAMADIERDHPGQCWTMTPREKLYSVCWSRRQYAEHEIRAESEEAARQEAKEVCESENLHVTLTWELDSDGLELMNIEEKD